MQTFSYSNADWVSADDVGRNYGLGCLHRPSDRPTLASYRRRPDETPDRRRGGGNSEIIAKRTPLDTRGSFKMHKNITLLKATNKVNLVGKLASSDICNMQ